ncbi:antibiotic biosynthesis monooxygenase [Streptomyces sp. NPDC006134]|uniref:antibiotic biosynthesis monooxygenase n=1 Tax=Streptomyces sp. NPDC006134 TaxID=3154467 RepID=UPI003403A52E
MACAVVAHHRSAPEHEGAAVREALPKARRATHAEPAYLMHEVHSVADEPGGFLLYERYEYYEYYEYYEGVAGFEAREAAAPHFEERIAETVGPLPADRPVVFAEVL